jgi:hypothetical protein
MATNQQSWRQRRHRPKERWRLTNHGSVSLPGDQAGWQVPRIEPQSNRKLAEQPFEDGPGLRRRTSECAQTSIANSESPLCVLDVACRPRIACSLAANALSRTSRRRSSPLSAAPRNAASPAHDTSKWSRQVQQRRRSPREPGPGALVRLLTPCAAETTAKIAARMQRTVSESLRAKCASRPDQT